MSHSRDLHALARVSGQLLDSETVVDAGLPRESLDQEMRAGRIVALQRGIYVPAAVADDPALRLRASLRAAGPGAVLSHRTAATHHGILVAKSEGLIEILIPHGRRCDVRGALVHRTRRLPEQHVSRLGGLPMTSIERTLADLGSVVPPWIVAKSVERSVIDRRTSIAALYRIADEHGRQGRTGIAALRSSLDEWLLGDSQPDSSLEVMFARLVDRASLPMPEFQYPVHDGDRVVARVDACWPAHRLIAEVDGLHAHSTAVSLQRDLSRQNVLVALGYRPLRFTWPDIVRRPDSVARQLAGFLQPV